MEKAHGAKGGGLSAQEKKSFMERLNSVRVPVTNYCRHLLWRRGDLEDALQEILTTAYEKYPQFEPGTSFRAWIFRIATYTVFNINRKYKRESERFVPMESEGPEVHPFIQQELSYQEILKDPDRILAHVGEEILAALSKLSANERAVFLLRGLADLSYREIAGILDMPLGSVMGYLGRARGKLRRSLTDYACERGMISRMGLV